MTQNPGKKLTRGQRVIKFIETYCVVPEGQHVGKPVVLAPFQKKFILQVYDNKYITDTAILSMARKNAKTALIAFIVITHLVGPEAVQNSRIVSGAMSKEQAGEVYTLASKTVMMSPKLNGKIHPVPSKKSLLGLAMNVEYQALSADAHTAHGKSPILAILDEVGQIRGPQSDFVDAIVTAQGAYEDPIVIYISTQAATDQDFFSVLIDDALASKPKKTVCHLYAAPDDADLLDEKAWKLANPALGLFRSLKDMRKQAEKAARMPSFENTYRNLNLNQRVTTKSPFVSKDVWKKCGKKHGVSLSDCEEIYGAVDLSKRTDLTAFLLMGRVGEHWYVFSWFWTPEEGLRARAKKDRNMYETWVKKGYLITTPGSTIQYEFVAKQIAEICKGLPVKKIAFDRWRMDILKKEMEDIAEFNIELLEEWGQGFKDMGFALDALEDKLLNSTVHHDDNPVLTMCAANSVVVKDPSENRKLDKAKATGRIDGMVCLAMCCGAAERYKDDEGDFEDFLKNPLKA